MKKFLPLFLSFLFLSATPVSSIKKPSEKTVIAYYIKEKMTIDGILNEPLYFNIPASDFTQLEPNEGEPATQRTEAWVGYDESYLYFGAKMYDSEPAAIDKMLARKDTFTETDRLWINIDTFLDRRTGMFFGITAGGSKADGTIYNDEYFDESWDGVWDSEVNISEDGWTMEMKIPFSQLRFNESKEMKWGINFTRITKRTNEQASFVMVPKVESGFVSWFATLEGLNQVKSKQRAEVLPYLVQKVQVLEHDIEDPFYKSNQFETSVGADFKLGIGSNLTLDATVNPDFGQVEVDPAVVNLSAFETFYQEKRPFFIEGANIFRFGTGGSNSNFGFNFGNPKLYYSRRIGRTPQGEIESESDYDYINYPNETRILGAAKLTGKIDESWSVGALSSVTERTYGEFQKDGTKFTEEIEPLTHYGAARFKKQFNGNKQAIGGIFTSVNRDLGDPKLNNQIVKEAYTYGLDGWTFLDNDETYIVTGSAIGSYVRGSKNAIEVKQREPYRYAQRPDATYAPLDTNKTTLTGWYSRVTLNKQKGNFIFNTAFGAASPGIEYNDLGFQRTADKVNGHLALGYSWYLPDGFFRRKRVFAAHFQTYDFEWDRISNGIMIFTHFEFENFFNIGFDGGYFARTISNKLTRGGPKAEKPSEYFFVVDGFTDSRKDYMIRYKAEIERDELRGLERSLALDFQWRPMTQMEFTIGPEYSHNAKMLQWVTDVEDERAVETYGGRYVFGEMEQQTISANIRLSWTFTPKLSLQLFLQPLLSVGDYSNFKELAQPRSLDYNYYGENGSTIDLDSDADEYIVDPDGTGLSVFNFENPNFNYRSLRANFVLRYEYLPGSIFYFVWTNSRSNSDTSGQLNFEDDMVDLWNQNTDNVFMLKLSYWIDI